LIVGYGRGTNDVRAIPAHKPMLLNPFFFRKKLL
jgi:hypothetical protein